MTNNNRKTPYMKRKSAITIFNFKNKTMKYFNQLTTLLLAIIFISSCKKDEIKTSPITSLTVGNFKISGKTVRIGSNLTTIANNNTNGTQMALKAGTNDLYVWPMGDSLNPYYVQNKFASADREAYSLFLCGDTLAQRGDAVLIKENIPYRTDSTCGIRFINLSPNSTPLNITLSTSTTVNEVSDLSYKQYTDYISYAGKYNSTYTFQVRAAANPGTVLASVTLTAAQVPRFANITLVIRGKMTGGAPTMGITRVNQDR